MSEVEQLVDQLLEQEPDDEAQEIFMTAPVTGLSVSPLILKRVRDEVDES